ncbi:MAG: cupin domain-containing protein, partial [Pseudomonadota bacterium]
MALAANKTTATALGADIRALRKSRGLTLYQLASQLNRSTGWLSHVERGQIDAGVNDLKNLAAVFDLPVSFFFRNDEAPEAERGTIVRAAHRAEIGNTSEGLTEELLSPDLNHAFEMIRSTFQPGAESGIVPARATEEGGYVAEGELILWIGGTRHHLHTGDSFHFARQPYRWKNPGT